MPATTPSTPDLHREDGRTAALRLARAFERGIRDPGSRLVVSRLIDLLEKSLGMLSRADLMLDQIITRAEALTTENANLRRDHAGEVQQYLTRIDELEQQLHAMEGRAGKELVTDATGGRPPSADSDST